MKTLPLIEKLYKTHRKVIFSQVKRALGNLPQNCTRDEVAMEIGLRILDCLGEADFNHNTVLQMAVKDGAKEN